MGGPTHGGRLLRFYLAGPLILAVRLMLPSLVGSPVLANIDDMRVLAAVIGDASGLLDGRDSGDACSAHIDAAAGLCVDCVCKCKCGSHILS